MGLNSIYESHEIDIPVLLDKDEMFLRLDTRLNDSNDDGIYLYLKSFATMTDDFTIFAFLYEDDIHILWKLTNNDTPFSDLNELDANVINFYKINKDEYLSKLKIIENKLLTFE